MKKYLACTALICMFFNISPSTSLAGAAGSFSVSEEAVKAGTRLLAESGEFATTPFRLENGNLLWTLGFAGMVGLVYSVDGEIRARLQNNRSRSVDRAADAGSIAGDPFLHLGVAALFYGGGILAESPRWKQTASRPQKWVSM